MVTTRNIIFTFLPNYNDKFIMPETVLKFNMKHNFCVLQSSDMCSLSLSLSLTYKGIISGLVQVSYQGCYLTCTYMIVM